MRFCFGAFALLTLRHNVVRAKPIPIVLRNAPTVDLGYGVYEGGYDSEYDVNVFKGIRYAAPPLGNLRFAAPQPPARNRSSAIPATTDPPICPQTGASAETPEEYGFVTAPGNEDCLFLNVFAPANAANLPVFFWIHGGGYSVFSATGLNPNEFMQTNNNSFVSVVIQYRLGAFGFLSGDDVKNDGALNAGLLDMNFALQWVQQHIEKFGGDPNRVTLAGESSGGASVMYQAMAYGGRQNQTLFNNIISSSPWIPHQYAYNDAIPTQKYNDFVSAAGCSNSTCPLECLRDASSSTLQNASGLVSESGPFGTFAFTPVTDGTFVQNLPTKQLLSRSLKGTRLLSGHLANEGIPLASPYIKTLSDFRSNLQTTFPYFTSADITALESQYAYVGDSSPVDPSSPLFATTGTSSPTAVNQSSFATGQQQRAFNVFAEYAFVCPSYWLADAFPSAWAYEFSALPAYHGYDLQALWSKDTPSPGQAFKTAFQSIWGAFITSDSPVISAAQAKGGASNSRVPEGEQQGMLEWPQWGAGGEFKLLSLNTTGGVEVLVNVTKELKYTLYTDPGVRNVLEVGDAVAWEGGRGERCRWWLEEAATRVPY